MLPFTFSKRGRRNTLTTCAEYAEDSTSNSSSKGKTQLAKTNERRQVFTVSCTYRPHKITNFNIVFYIPPAKNQIFKCYFKYLGLFSP